MFRNWGFLISEMTGLLLIAALVGLFVGWLIWARRRSNTHTHSHSQDEGRLEQLQADLDTCRSGYSEKDARIAQIQADLDSCRAKHTDKDARIAQLETELSAAHRTSVAVAAPAAVSEVAPVTADLDTIDYDGDGILEDKNEGTRPEALSGPRGGVADDLKRIKGIGPKLEVLCHSLGFYHFDQVAGWTADEVAWVNANLEGFKGRVTRDNWVEQAKTLAAGGETEFSRRVDKGGVY